MKPSQKIKKRINIVDPPWGWVLSWFGRMLTKGLSRVADVTFAHESAPDADLNYHFTWFELPNWRKSKLDVGHFTHLNTVYPFDVEKALGRFDHLVAMSEHGKEVLTGRGIEESKITVIHPGNDGFTPKERRVINIPNKIQIGVSGKIYANGRKREWLPVELSWRTSLDRFAFIFVGDAWGQIVRAMQCQDVTTKWIKELPYDKYPEVIASLDAYLCTAYAEGGPMGALQAMGCGVPVISPNYAFAHDFGALYYDNVDALVTILEDFKPHQREPVRTSWQDWVGKHWKVFRGLLDDTPRR